MHIRDTLDMLVFVEIALELIREFFYEHVHSVSSAVLWPHCEYSD